MHEAAISPYLSAAYSLLQRKIHNTRFTHNSNLFFLSFTFPKCASEHVFLETALIIKIFGKFCACSCITMFTRIILVQARSKSIRRSIVTSGVNFVSDKTKSLNIVCRFGSLRKPFFFSLCVFHTHWRCVKV